MRDGIYRMLRIAVVGGGAFLGYRALSPMGYGWVVLVVAGVLASLWIGYRAYRARLQRQREARADRWAEALLVPPKRPAAFREIREVLRQAETRRPVEHARVTLVLAELLDADGEPEAAVEALQAVDETRLPKGLAAIVRHASAVAHLSAGDPEGAAQALDGAEPSGSAEIELRIRMMRGLIAAERGQVTEAKRIAKESREDALDDEDLRLEARLLEAVAIDAGGDRRAAIKRMLRLGDEMLDILVVMGLPRVRALAAAAIESRD